LGNGTLAMEIPPSTGSRIGSVLKTDTQGSLSVVDLYQIAVTTISI